MGERRRRGGLRNALSGGIACWDVVKVPFAYANRPIQQARPAMVLAVLRAAGMPAMLWVLMITSAGNRRWPRDILVSDLSIAGLPAPSVVRTAKIATVGLNLVQRLGTIGETDAHPDRASVRRQLDATLRPVLALA